MFKAIKNKLFGKSRAPSPGELSDEMISAYLFRKNMDEFSSIGTLVDPNSKTRLEEEIANVVANITEITLEKSNGKINPTDESYIFPSFIITMIASDALCQKAPGTSSELATSTAALQLWTKHLSKEKIFENLLDAVDTFNSMTQMSNYLDAMIESGRSVNAYFETRQPDQLLPLCDLLTHLAIRTQPRENSTGRPATSAK
ncbi:hypothetical protein [Lysobacter sp. A378]